MSPLTRGQKKELHQIIDRFNRLARVTVRENRRVDVTKKLRLIRQMATLIEHNDGKIPPALAQAVKRFQAVEQKVYEGIPPTVRKEWLSSPRSHRWGPFWGKARK